MTEEFNPKNKIWTEKYRPTAVSQLVGKDVREKVKKYLVNPDSIPHFLLHSGAPGTGKTSLAKCIINELGADSLILNSSDDRKIEVIREKVKEFALTQSSKKGKRRIIFMDEADGMLSASQHALRNIFETYASNVIFILTCNNINKIIEPLQSRCQLIGFAYPDKDEVFNYLTTICKSEGLNYSDEGLKELIRLNYPSIRNCVVTLQDLFTEGVEVNKETVRPYDDKFNTLWEKLKQKDWKGIKEDVLSSTINSRELNRFFWERALEEENLKVLQVTCRNEKDINIGADEKVIFVTSLIEMCK